MNSHHHSAGIRKENLNFKPESCIDSNNGMNSCADSHIGFNPFAQDLKELDFLHSLGGLIHSQNRTRLESTLSKHPNLNVMDPSGYYPIHYAVCREGSILILDLVLSQSPDLNVRTRSGGKTSLHRACLFGRLDMIHALLKAGAESDLVNGEGETLLQEAQRGGNEPCIHFLMNQFKNS